MPNDQGQLVLEFEDAGLRLFRLDGTRAQAELVETLVRVACRRAALGFERLSAGRERAG